MIYWKICGISVIAFIITLIVTFIHEEGELCFANLLERGIMEVITGAIMIPIVAAKFFCFLVFFGSPERNVYVYILSFISTALLILGASIIISAIIFCLGENSEVFTLEIALWIVGTVLFTIIWCIPIGKYNSRIESVESIEVVSKEDRELIYFDPSGNKESSNNNEQNDGKPQIIYWYLDEKNQGVVGTADAENSKIIFIDDEETSHVFITKYNEKTTKYNHNNNTEKTIDIKESYKYEFYVHRDNLKQ